MAIYGRALRQEAKDREWERQHPEAAGQRVRRRELGEQVNRERAERYPVLNDQNADEAIKWQTARLEELERAEGLR